jgi:hypothetical protein
MEIDAFVKQKVNIKSVSVHVKVCDSGNYDLKDANGNVLKEIQDYVPSFFPGEHYGDYLILDIDIETGMITNWVKPTADKLLRLFTIEE